MGCFFLQLLCILFVHANAPVDGAVDQNIDIILLKTVDDLCTEDQ